MNTADIAKLFEVAKHKNQIDQKHDWSSGSATYIDELRKELIEVEDEIAQDRGCYLEDELGDVLWDYLNILICLEQEKNISVANVFKRALQKYDERISAIEAGGTWAKTKAKQKKKLLDEHHSELTEVNT